MPQPTPYSRAIDFTPLIDPSMPEAGARVNAELDAAASFTRAATSRLALIQRDDGAPANQIVTLDTLAPSLRALIGNWNPRGAWATATAYAARDVVSTAGATYVAVADHTSGVFATDLAATKWLALLSSDDALTGSTSLTITGGSSAATLDERFGVSVNPVLDFGADPTGVADATSAINAALATGKRVVLSAGTYKLSGSLEMTTTGQVLEGDGRGAVKLVPTGNFDVIKMLRPAEMMTVRNIQIDATGMTGGNALYTDSPRSVFERIKIESPWNVFYGTKCSALVIDTLQAGKPRGAYGLKFYTALPDRSDVLYVQNVVIGDGTTTGRTWDGIIVDGQVATVYFDAIDVLAPQRGLVTQNTTGNALALPTYLYFTPLNVDFPAEQAVYAGAGAGFYFDNLYANSSATTEAVFISSAVHDVEIEGGLLRGALKEGLVIAGQDVSVIGAKIVFNSYPTYYAYPAARLNAAARRVRFLGCQFGQMQGIGATVSYGCIVDSGAQGVRFSGCDFSGCILGDVLDSSGVAAGNVDITGSGATEQFQNDRANGLEFGMRDGEGGQLTATVTAGAITALSGFPIGARMTTTPTVLAFDPAGTGSGFTATPTVSGGICTGASITNGGTGYSAGTVVIVRPGAREPTLRGVRPGLTDVTIRVHAGGAGKLVLGNDDTQPVQINEVFRVVPRSGDPTVTRENGQIWIDGSSLKVRLGGTDYTVTVT